MLNLSTKDWYVDNIETVIFDKDGTFIDLHYFWGKMTELRALEVIKYYNITSTNTVEVTRKNDEFHYNKLSSISIPSIVTHKNITYTVTSIERNAFELLKKLQETQGNITLGELSEYVIREVKRKSSVINKTQEPSVSYAPNVADQWRNWRLK